ncbi:nuclear membrane protein [Coprinopsis marcescibilis]|uniref:Nuclear membrane protein n=1 Tax=Coprinopsis marcescibilis TaxID=230819 RepID=A0A5C3KID5_COPMA|nr:nuclear membrane protein [Coprinopsis marcescibilis]
MSRSGAHRSREAPMDFEWTNRPATKPAWSSHGEDPSTPKKRSLEPVNPATPGFGAPVTPSFGRNQNVPFLFNPGTVPQTPQGYPWVPPSPTKQQPEILDVDMNEASPAKAEEPQRDEDKEVESARPVASGGLRRIYNQRKRTQTRSRARHRSDDHDDSGSGSESEEETEKRVGLRRQATSNHYTLNMAPPTPPRSEMPYVLLGYTQFFFNLSLILVFLYILIQSILTIQKDVEKRISEYTQDIVQEIALCAAQFRDNYCDSPRLAPALAQPCANWETCMNRDPTKIGRARVSAELIAEVINGFVEPISWKTLIFTLTSLAFLTVFINSLLSLYREKLQPNAATVQPASSFPLVPAASYPSMHPFGGFLSPAPTPNWQRFKSYTEEDMESPTRRRRLEGGASAKIK